MLALGRQLSSRLLPPTPTRLVRMTSPTTLSTRRSRAKSTPHISAGSYPSTCSCWTGNSNWRRQREAKEKRREEKKNTTITWVVTCPASLISGGSISVDFHFSRVTRHLLRAQLGGALVSALEKRARRREKQNIGRKKKSTQEKSSRHDTEE
jgi:hypothetical protein